MFWEHIGASQVDGISNETGCVREREDVYQCVRSLLERVFLPPSEYLSALHNNLKPQTTLALFAE